MDSLVKKKIFNNKVIIITGASSGLGKTISKAFIKEGAKVSLCSRRLGLLKKNYKIKKKVFFQKLDVCNEKSIKKFIKKNNKNFWKS